MYHLYNLLKYIQTKQLDLFLLLGSLSSGSFKTNLKCSWNFSKLLTKEANRHQQSPVPLKYIYWIHNIKKTQDVFFKINKGSQVLYTNLQHLVNVYCYILLYLILCVDVFMKNISRHYFLKRGNSTQQKYGNVKIIWFFISCS